MAAYAALVSLAQTTDHTRNQLDKYLYFIHAKERIRSIHEYAIFLISFLEDFPEKVKHWEGRIRDLAYKTEDIIELHKWQQLQSLMNLSSIQLEEQLENAMEEIGLIAGEVMEERPAAAVSSSSSRVTPTGNDAVIGLDDDQMEVKVRLCGQSSKLQVIPIVGMGGIGKTTLARTVYDDPLIVEHFHIRAWLTVSQDYNEHRFREMCLHSIKQLEEQMSSGLNIDEFGEVYKHLKGRRYLIVLDDVWDSKVWDDVRDIFPDDGNGSRIMLTTRVLDVAAYPDPNSPLHEMQIMDDYKSWDLLKLKVFTNTCICPPELEDVGKEIARSCAGLPLAVVLVAGLLSAVDETRASWEKIANVNLLVGRGMEEILLLSYTHLPHHLRPCFLFLGGFPEDEIIRGSRLIKLWVAEGFLRHQNGISKTMEEEAEEYLDDLVRRNLVTVTNRKSNGKIKSCNLHDMVRELCIRKSREEKFLRVMDGSFLPQGMMNERRISFSCSDIDDINWCQIIRTILCFQTKSFWSWLAFLGNFNLIRVLDALGVDLKELPLQLFELYHLRYLALMGSFNIPSLISNLLNLQTLIIHQAFEKPGKRYWRYQVTVSHSLPWEIWRMLQLRHVILYGLYKLPNDHDLPPYGCDLPLENLQTFSPVTNLVWNEKVLQMIPNVKKLGLVYTINKDYQLHHLKSLHQLEKLEVTGHLNFSWQGHSCTFPSSLKKLSLVGGEFPWKDMAIIGSLPHLQVLKLLRNACDGETWETTDEEFPQLIFLLIDGSHLQQWITHSSPFPRLKRLVLRSFYYLRDIPEDIGNISTLELIKLKYCTKSLGDSAKQIKEDQESYGNDALQVRVSHEVRALPISQYIYRNKTSI